VDFGTTSRGTPVRINRRVAESRRRILIGAVVFHYFAGYGGGRKLLLPGVAARESIAHNHAMTLDPAEDRINPAVRIGRMPGNPVAEDMLEAARMVGADYCINSVLDRTGGIAGLYCGHMEHAHAAGVEHARRMFAAHIPQQADLVIANAGNVRNFVQSHKALYNAWQAMKPNGRIVLATRCEEGLGTARFIEWVRMADRATIIRELRKRGEINGQTALSTREKAPSALFVTELGEDEVGALGGRKVSCLQAGVDQAFAELRERGVSRPTCWIMPSAAYTVPFVGQMEMSALQ
jgi:nickel-dependent lactate racemase